VLAGSAGCRFQARESKLTVPQPLPQTGDHLTQFLRGTRSKPRYSGILRNL